MQCDDYMTTGSHESASTSDSGDLKSTTATNSEAASITVPSDIHIQCELLCFVQRKCSVLAVEDLVNVCTSFYSMKEIEKARNLLSEYVTDRRLTKRTGSEREKARKTMSDIVTI